MKIGLLGGIGPKATGDFYLQLIGKLRASGHVKSNCDYPQIIINSINAEELTSNNFDEKMLEKYVLGIRELSLYQPDFIVMVCNTIHLYRDYLIEKTGFNRILSIRDVVEVVLPTSLGKICVLASPLTVNEGLYEYDGYDYYKLDPVELDAIGTIVNSYNAYGDRDLNQYKLLRVIDRSKKSGVDIFLVACTELSDLLSDQNDFKIIDTFNVLLDFVLKKIIS